MVSDLWPEAAVQLGVLRNRVMIRFSEWLEWSTYQRAALVWVVTEWIRDRLIERGYPQERILLLTNGVDLTKFHPLPKAVARAELGWSDQFTVLYVGTHGVTHGLMTILDAAEQLREHKHIHLILIGEGADKPKMVARAQKLGLTNITFLDSLSHELVSKYIVAGDVCLAHVRKVPVAEGILPIKMFEAMACGRPVVLALNGEARRVAVEEAEAAIYAEPENPSALASAILYLYEHPEIAAVMGANGRAYVEKRFDYDRLTEILEEHIATILGQEASSSSQGAPALAQMQKSSPGAHQLNENKVL
jgi:glycosyltransferase involved in cell wall biosynthesis